MKVVILKGDDWQGFFIDGKLIDEGHTLGDGYADTYLLSKSEELGFKLKDVVVSFVTEEDEDYLYDHGCYPENIEELNGEY